MNLRRKLMRLLAPYCERQRDEFRVRLSETRSLARAVATDRCGLILQKDKEKRCAK